MSNNKWTDWEVAIVKECYANSPQKEILAKLLNKRSWAAIMRQAREEEIRRVIDDRPAVNWDPLDVEFLKQNYATASKKEILERIPKEWAAIQTKVSSLKKEGVSNLDRVSVSRISTQSRPWNKQEDIDYVRANYKNSNVSPEEMESHLGRAWTSIQKYATNVLGEKRQGGVKDGQWRPEEEALLVELLDKRASAEEILSRFLVFKRT